MSVFIDRTALMDQYLAEPKIVRTGGAEAKQITETATFTWPVNDADAIVVMQREVAYDAADELVRQEAWAVTNSPTITDITLTVDGNVSNTVSLDKTTILEITGTNFGATVSDLEVLTFVPPHNGWMGPQPRPEMLIPYRATITDLVGGNSITASLILDKIGGVRWPAKGLCYVEVRHLKRRLKSERFQLEVA